MPTYRVTKCFSNLGTRNQARKGVIETFLEEIPGTGTGDSASKYIYYVENLENGNRIYLTRPGFKNKQFDFVINVENVNFNKGAGNVRTAPTHKDIFDDLALKKSNYETLYRKLFEMIKAVFECRDIPISSCKELQFDVGLPVDLILGVIKWYFIEQDIAYWNYSGRNMFMSGIPVL